MLEKGHLTLNSMETDCDALQIFELGQDFEIISNGKKMTNYHIKSSKSQRLNRGSDYEFSNLPITYLSDIEEDTSILHPILDELLLTPAGEIQGAKVAAISGGSFLILFLCVVATPRML